MTDLPNTQRLIAYDAWGNLQATRSLQRLPDVPDRLSKLVAHIIGAEWNWLARIRQEKSIMAIWPQIDPFEWERQFNDVYSAWDAYLRAHTQDELLRTVNYVNSKGDAFSNTVSDIVTHVVIHSEHHRGQIASTVRELGGQPAVTDYIQYVRSVSAQ